MSRLPFAAALAAIAAVGCWRAVRPPSTAEVTLEGQADPDGGGPCHYSMTLFPYGCRLEVAHDTKDPEYSGRWYTMESVDCGASANVCGTAVRCDCSPPPDQNCGDDAGLVELRQRIRLDGGGDCHVSIGLPSGGACRGTVDYIADNRMTTGPIKIPFNESRRLCRGHVEQRCTCDAFPRKCSYEARATFDGRCQVVTHRCGPGGCEDVRMTFEPGELAVACDERFRCRSESLDGGR
jgi:hypothetical protein